MPVSEKVIRKIMRHKQLLVKVTREKKYISYVGEISPSVPNLVNRIIHAEEPNKLWLTDITEFHITAGKVYLSPIIDCFDGMPVTWAIGTSHNANLVNTMLDHAIGILSDQDHPIIHSDRGCQYRWPGWIKKIEKAGLTRFMSKKVCSPDNSACEGFFGRLKNDQYLYWYCNKRIKLSLGSMSPMAYRHKL